jgi:hypothetical protein
MSRVASLGFVASSALLCCWASPAAAQVSLNAYGDINYVVERSQQTTNSFQMPRLELFPTATQDRLSFLTEIMFEVDEQNNFVVDVERTEVAYLFSDYFRVKFGRFHTAIGYYNDAYHHGRYFQMTVDRPEMVRFEDEGGLLPAHSVGVHVDGLLPLGPLGSVRYDIDGANGRGPVPDSVTNAVDPNNQKAFNLRLRFEPSFPDGLMLGGNVYVDKIHASQPEPSAAPVDVDEVILGAHLAYLENYVHLIAEYLRIQHKFFNRTGITQGAFGELGYTFGIVTPYARVQWVKFPAEADIDPFLAGNVLVPRGSFVATVGGFRINVSDYLAVKLEGGYTKLDSGGNIKTGALQCAFAF